MPLLSMVVIADAQVLSDVEEMQLYVKEELDVREVVLSSVEERFNILLEARVDWPTLGKKLKNKYLREKRITVEGIDLEEDDLHIARVLGTQASVESSEKGEEKWEASFSEEVVVLLDIAPDTELLRDGLVRDIINRSQKMRKTAQLIPGDDVCMQYTIM
ncbi:hypothetical protein Daus18300_006558 [Diaporthe australafricana]|uniref:Isoleucyl-tRNA synthetase n=1 Tax=Diaporthe australafricana TaxID=127596 RepID=A0ABR3WTC9_9PEZI